ncbi:MAG: PTS sugar transporter subunit IIB [Erysipelotrichaceae bacterium]|nr:PTS sugar transporter subunit IIB [Erysipelotrichaceae bacterium]
MLKLVLLCQYGASTGMLTQKIRQAAKDRGLEAEVNAYSYSDVGKYVDEADVILLGPQIRFKKEEFEKKYADKNTPFVVIETLDYGRMNGEAVLNNALKALEK